MRHPMTLLQIPKPERRATGFANAAVIILFVEHLFFGANRTDLALAFAVIYALFLLAILSTGWGADRFKAISPSLLVPGLAFGLCLAALILAGQMGRVIDPQAHLNGLIGLCGLALLFLAGAILGADRECRRQLSKTMSICGLLFGIFSLVQYCFMPDPKHDFAAGRLAATFVSPNTAATLFGMLALMVLPALLPEGRTGPSSSAGQAADTLLRRAPVEAAAFITAVTCLVLTGSRMAEGAFAACLLLLLLWEERGRRRWGSRNIVFVFLLFGLLSAAGGQLLVARLLSAESDLAWRTVLLAAHWRAFLTAPLWGYGLGSFPLVNARVMKLDTMLPLALMGAVHNVYLQWLEQAGLLGALPMFFCLAWIIAVIAKRKLRGLTVISLFVLLHGLADYGLEVPSIAAMWALLLGLGYGRAQCPLAITPATGTEEGFRQLAGG